MMLRKYKLYVSILLLFTAQNIHATTGYFALGYGPKSMGMAGATVASPQDALSAANNPAGMAHVGERLDFGLKLFSPVREASLGAIEDESIRDFFNIW